MHGKREDPFCIFSLLLKCIPGLHCLLETFLLCFSPHINPKCICMPICIVRWSQPKIVQSGWHTNYQCEVYVSIKIVYISFDRANN
jgi:hypothetical protein